MMMIMWFEHQYKQYKKVNNWSLQAFSEVLTVWFNKLTSVFCVCPVIDDDFHHNIVKIAVDPRGTLPRMKTCAWPILQELKMPLRESFGANVHRDRSCRSRGIAQGCVCPIQVGLEVDLFLGCEKESPSNSSMG